MTYLLRELKEESDGRMERRRNGRRCNCRRAGNEKCDTLKKCSFVGGGVFVFFSVTAVLFHDGVQSLSVSAQLSRG